MNVESLTLENYRNVQSQTVRFSKGLNILYGENGAGKTNLLEAVSLFSLCKSHRTSKDSDFIAHGAENAHLSMEYRSDFDRADARVFRKSDIRYFSDGKKRLYCDGVPIGKVSEFVGRFRSVLFTPDHLSLIKGSPDERRKFCDMALSQIKPGYIRRLNDYNACLNQRNALLKQLRDTGSEDRMLLTVYTESICKLGAKIVRQRMMFCRYLQELAQIFYREISGDSEKLFIRYYGNVKDTNPYDMPTETRIGNELFALYAENIDSEVRMGLTKYGPHRDDFLFFMGKVSQNDDCCENDDVHRKEIEFSARTFASQGQQRSTVLALKLSEGEMMEKMTGEQPVYLFDDVLSELDPNRRERFLSVFQNKQVLLTCCDENIARSLSGRKIYVENGIYSVEEE